MGDYVRISVELPDEAKNGPLIVRPIDQDYEHPQVRDVRLLARERKADATVLELELDVIP